MNKELATTPLMILQDDAIKLFVHHLQVAVSCLEATPLNMWDAMTAVHRLEGVSDTMKSFAANEVMTVFKVFEFDEENYDATGLDIVEINLNDPDAMQKLHETIAHFTGDESAPQ